MDKTLIRGFCVLKIVLLRPNMISSNAYHMLRRISFAGYRCWKQGYFHTSYGSPYLCEKLTNHIGSKLQRHFEKSTGERDNELTAKLLAEMLQSSKIVSNQEISDYSDKVFRGLDIMDKLQISPRLLNCKQIIEFHEDYIRNNLKSFESITSRHDAIRSQPWEVAITDSIGLASYSVAAKNMAKKPWVMQGNDWMANFAIAFFRQNGARKDFIKWTLVNHLKCTGTEMDKQSIELLKLQLVQDLCSNSRSQNRLEQITTSLELHSGDSRKIRLLDVGSCSNPLAKLASASFFDITAVDLFPGDDSVLQCDFLTEPVHEIGSNDDNCVRSACKLESNSYDVVTMSLVLSYLPTASQRLEMIKKAHKLLISPPRLNNTISTRICDSHEPDVNDDLQWHRAGLLLIIEKDSIFPEITMPAHKLTAPATILQDWKTTIRQCGFEMVKYRVLTCAEDGRRSHAFAFRKLPEPLLAQPSTLVHSSFDVSLRDEGLWIKQDFHRHSSDNHQQHLHIKTGGIDSAKLPVVIIGGGIGGAALARALHNRGVDYLLCEQDSEFHQRKQGYALTIQQGACALKALGISNEDLVQATVPGTSSPLLNDGDDAEIGQGAISHAHQSTHAITGQLLGRYGSIVQDGQFKHLDGLPPPSLVGSLNHNIHIPRQVLRHLLVKDLSPHKVMWGRKFQSYESLPEESSCGAGVNVMFSDGSYQPAAVMVAADGIFSTVRGQFLRQCDSSGYSSLAYPPLNYLGLIVILGISPLIAPTSVCLSSAMASSECEHFPYFFEKVTGDRFTHRLQSQWLDGDARMFTMPFNRTHSMWQLSFPFELYSATGLSATELRRLALEKVCKWQGPARALVESTSLSLISGHPAYDRDAVTADVLQELRRTDSSRASHSVTLLGDAFHPMSPFKGQGANQALLDAMSLSKCLMSSQLVHTSRRPVSKALAAFEIEMTKRSAEKVAKSRAAAQLLHSPFGLTSANVTRAMAAEMGTASSTAH